jgi:type IV pilus assembly protein PilM
MTIWNQNDDENDEQPSGEPGWEQGETQELSMREVSFRRRPTDEPHASDPAAHDDVVDDAAADSVEMFSDAGLQPVTPETAPEKVPFYKREITLGRKKRPEPAYTVAVPAAAAEPAPAADAVGEAPPAPAAVEPPAEQEAATAAGLRARKGGGGLTVAGVKIGQSTISVAVAEQRAGVDELTRLARRPLQPGVVVDGEVKDVPALAKALETLWAEEGLPRKNVRLGLFGSRIGVRPVDIVGIEEADQFANAVRFKAHEVLPIGVHESVLDFRVLSERVNETGERVRRTLLVVAPRDQVLPYVEAFRTARIGLAAVDIDALALLRAFVDPGQPGLTTAEDSAAVVVAMDREGSTLLVAGGGQCDFTRAFDWGGNLVAAGVAEQLEVSLDQAWDVLESLARHGAAGKPVEDEQGRQAAEVVRARLVPFARELVSSLQFYQQQHGSLGIADIVLTGPLADVPGVVDALHQLIGVAVRVGDPTARLVVRGAPDEGQHWTLGSMATPIGLAVTDRAERAVDLIPPDQRVKIRWRPRLAPVLLPAAAAIPLAVVGFSFFQASSTVSERQGTLDAVQAELAALPEPNASIDPALTGEAGQRAASVASLLGQRLAWNGMLDDLSRVLPSDVWLTTVSASLPAVPGAAPPLGTGTTSVEIAGKAVSYPALAQALTRLSTLPSLSDVKLFNSTAEEIGLPNGKKVKVVGFQISANVDSAGGS